MKSEDAWWVIKDIIAKVQREHWSDEIKARDPAHDILVGELIALRSRYHEAWLAIADCIRTIRTMRNTAEHRILGDTPQDWDVKPDKVNDLVDLRQAYPDLPSAKQAHKQYMTRVLEIEAIINFDRLPIEQRLEQLVLTLGRRVEALERERATPTQSKGRK